MYEYLSTLKFLDFSPHQNFLFNSSKCLFYFFYILKYIVQSEHAVKRSCINGYHIHPNAPFFNPVFFLCSAFGFHLEESLFSFNQKCIEDPDSGINIHKPPSPCPPGTFYPYSRGYQKIPGDTCQYGEDYRYDPLMYSCPVAGTHKQFLMLLLR